MTPTKFQAEWNEATRGDHSVLADWGVEVICLQQDRGTEKAGVTVDNCCDSSGVGLGMVVSCTARGLVHLLLVIAVIVVVFQFIGRSI